VYAAPCSRAGAWTIFVLVPKILCILRVATNFTSQVLIKQLGSGAGRTQAKSRAVARWPKSRTELANSKMD
jgi:hypothetical protein